MHILNIILNLPLTNLNHWGYWLILLASTIEASPLLGIIIPGQTIVMFGGFLVKMEILHFWGVAAVAAIGAIMGDFVGYALGRKYGHDFIVKYGKYFLLKEKNYEKTKKLIHEHTGKTLFIGRFNSITRALSPFVAGSVHVGFYRFLFFNITGGICWALSFTILGYIFGHSFALVSKYVGRFILAGFIIGGFLIYAYHFLNKKRHLFAKYHLRLLALNIISIYLFSKMLEDLIDNEWIIKIDHFINTSVPLWWSPILNKIMILITTIGDKVVIIPLTFLVFIFLIYRKKWYNSLLLIFAVGGGGLLELIVKSIVKRPRPVNSLIFRSDFSFPSGHAIVAIIFFSLLLYFFKNEIKNKFGKMLFIIGNITLFLAISFSRIYLNIHWTSDVIAGLALGLFWLSFLVLVFKIISSLEFKTIKSVKEKLEKLF